MNTEATTTTRTPSSADSGASVQGEFDGSALSFCALVSPATALATPGDIALARARVLQRINPHGTRLSELAEAAQVTEH
jgi:hypothetical protein